MIFNTREAIATPNVTVIYATAKEPRMFLV